MNSVYNSFGYPVDNKALIDLFKHVDADECEKLIQILKFGSNKDPESLAVLEWFQRTDCESVYTDSNSVGQPI